MFKISAPTKEQLAKDLRNIILTFVTVAYAHWQLYGHQFNRSSIIGATAAGGLAVISFVKSLLTTL